MKSTEFLTEAESNLAVKKLDKYLDMLSNDNLRGLIPLVRKSLSMNEADDEPIQYFGKIAPDARPASKPVSSPTLTAPVISNKSSEESKISQVISNLSQEEKKELLSLLQKEAKSRPASQPASKDNKRPSEKQTKKDDKGPGVFKGCLLPIAGIIGLLSLIPDSDEKSKSDSSGQTTQQVGSPATQTTVTPTDTYTWEPKTYWYHTSQTVGIDDKKTDFYSVRSNNEIDLDFPYGKTRMDMVVRYNNGKLASNDGGVYLQSKGQFHDGSGDVYGGYIRVKFDDGPVKRYRYLDPADNSTGTAFIEADHAFVSNLKKSKKIKIEIGYYQNSNQVFEFDTTGLSYAIEQEKK